MRLSNSVPKAKNEQWSFCSMLRGNCLISFQNKADLLPKFVAHCSNNSSKPSSSLMIKALLTEILNPKIFCSTATSISRFQTLVFQHSAKATRRTVFCLQESELRDINLQKCKKVDTLDFRLISLRLESFCSSCTMELLHFWAPSLMIRFTSLSRTGTLPSFGLCMKRKSL